MHTMLIYFCPDCWHEADPVAIRCGRCGTDLTEHLRLPYEQKLLQAVRHPVREARLLAIQLLGQLRSEEALPEWERLLADEADCDLLFEVVHALAELSSHESQVVLRIAARHPSMPVAETAKRILQESLRNLEEPSVTYTIGRSS